MSRQAPRHGALPDERPPRADVTGGHVRPVEERDGLWLVLAAVATALLVALL